MHPRKSAIRTDHRCTLRIAVNHALTGCAVADLRLLPATIYLELVWPERFLMSTSGIPADGHPSAGPRQELSSSVSVAQLAQDISTAETSLRALEARVRALEGGRTSISSVPGVGGDNRRLAIISYVRAYAATSTNPAILDDGTTGLSQGEIIQMLTSRLGQSEKAKVSLRRRVAEAEERINTILTTASN
ncbi:hypothetical protein PENSPDRAFT_666312, partial [Peniophora sp. CONT]